MNKIKSLIESDRGKTILTVLIVILVGVASFELGRLSKNRSSGIKIEYPSGLQAQNQAGTVILATTEESLKPPAKTVTGASKGGFMASSRGSKYYPVNCDAGKNLKPENRIYFDSREAAEAAGYELSASCR